MKKRPSIFVRLLPHFVVVMALMIITFVIFNFYNPYMQFIDNDFTQILLVVFSVLAIVESYILIVKSRASQ